MLLGRCAPMKQLLSSDESNLQGIHFFFNGIGQACRPTQELILMGGNIYRTPRVNNYTLIRHSLSLRNVRVVRSYSVLPAINTRYDMPMMRNIERGAYTDDDV